MSNVEITMVRIYITEGDHLFRRLINFLHNEEKVCGVTAFRGIAGFGRSGKAHESSLLDVSLDLPLVIEFFDRPVKAAKIIQDLHTMVDPKNVVYWPGFVNMSE